MEEPSAVVERFTSSSGVVKSKKGSGRRLTVILRRSEPTTASELDGERPVAQVMEEEEPLAVVEEVEKEVENAMEVEKEVVAAVEVEQATSATTFEAMDVDETATTAEEDCSRLPPTLATLPEPSFLPPLPSPPAEDVLPVLAHTRSSSPPPSAPLPAASDSTQDCHSFECDLSPIGTYNEVEQPLAAPSPAFVDATELHLEAQLGATVDDIAASAASPQLENVKLPSLPSTTEEEDKQEQEDDAMSLSDLSELSDLDDEAEEGSHVATEQNDETVQALSAEKELVDVVADKMEHAENVATVALPAPLSPPLQSLPALAPPPQNDQAHSAPLSSPPQTPILATSHLPHVPISPELSCPPLERTTPSSFLPSDTDTSPTSPETTLINLHQVAEESYARAREMGINLMRLPGLEEWKIQAAVDKLEEEMDEDEMSLSSLSSLGDSGDEEASEEVDERERGKRAWIGAKREEGEDGDDERDDEEDEGEDEEEEEGGGLEHVVGARSPAFDRLASPPLMIKREDPFTILLGEENDSDLSDVSDSPRQLSPAPTATAFAPEEATTFVKAVSPVERSALVDYSSSESEREEEQQVIRTLSISPRQPAITLPSDSNASQSVALLDANADLSELSDLASSSSGEDELSDLSSSDNEDDDVPSVSPLRSEATTTTPPLPLSALEKERSALLYAIKKEGELHASSTGPAFEAQTLSPVLSGGVVPDSEDENVRTNAGGGNALQWGVMGLEKGKEKQDDESSLSSMDVSDDEVDAEKGEQQLKVSPGLQLSQSALAQHLSTTGNDIPSTTKPKDEDASSLSSISSLSCSDNDFTDSDDDDHCSLSTVSSPHLAPSTTTTTRYSPSHPFTPSLSSSVSPAGGGVKKRPLFYVEIKVPSRSRTVTPGATAVKRRKVEEGSEQETRAVSELLAIKEEGEERKAGGGL